MSRYFRFAHHFFSIVVFSLTFSFQVKGSEINDTCCITDSTANKESLIKRVLNYFKESNTPVKHEGIDFSFLGGPHYSSDTKLGLGLVAAGQYYTTPATDSVTRMSNVSLVGDITTGGFYKIGIRGNHYTPQNRWRFDYYVDFYSFLRQFWGIGYDAGVHYDDYTKFKELRIKCNADFLYNVCKDIYFGPSASFTHLKANDIKEPALWNGQRLSTYTTSLGLKFLYDSRDNLTAPQRGWAVSLLQGFSPRFMGNHYAFSFTDLSASGYFKGWRDAIIAIHLHSLCNYGKVPWGMMATFGGSDIMRGYYEGRFRDKCEVDATIELRQHVWRRNGIVVWAGVGSVAPNPGKFAMKRLLPNGGIGYRWEFKKRTNVRLDFGVGKGETSFIFNINEAF